MNRGPPPAVQLQHNILCSYLREGAYVF